MVVFVPHVAKHEKTTSVVFAPPEVKHETAIEDVGNQKSKETS